jgi:signal transduction histidine kinase
MISEEIFPAIISTTLLVLLLVFGIVITFFISGRRRIKQQMELAETKLTFERELRQVETEVSENMMGQFAEELHDNIGQLLTALHIQVENQKLDHPALVESFKPVEIYLAEINQQLRLLSRTFNNDYIGRIGLLAAIQLEVDRLKSLKRFAVHYEASHGLCNLEKNDELMVFRIFQEIVQNALRHASAKNLYISVNNIGDDFQLSVKDDGLGFDKEAVLQSNKASGLRNILKRAKLAGVACTITTAPGEGSLFILKKVSNLG